MGEPPNPRAGKQTVSQIFPGQQENMTHAGKHGYFWARGISTCWKFLEENFWEGREEAVERGTVEVGGTGRTRTAPPSSNFHFATGGITHLNADHKNYN